MAISHNPAGELLAVGSCCILFGANSQFVATLENAKFATATPKRKSLVKAIATTFVTKCKQLTPVSPHFRRQTSLLLLAKMDILRRLYKLETLDSRFASKTGEPIPGAQPSKWRTPEYYVYYLFFLTIPVLMVKAVYEVSGPWHPSYQHYQNLLEPGWIPGRMVDNSDAQYRSFRDNIPYMAVLVVVHPLLRRIYEQFAGPAVSGSDGSRSKAESSAAAADARMNRRITFDLVFACIFLLALHGISAFKVLFILYLNYQIATALPKHYVPVATWVFNIAILFANELSHGYRFNDFAKWILPPETTNAGYVRGNLRYESVGQWVDSYGGLMPRWEILFNICVLRLIAFNFDYVWSLDRRAGSPVEVRFYLTICACILSGNLGLLTRSRRNRSTRRISRNATASPRQRSHKTSPFAIISPTSCTPPSTSSAQSSTLTTTSANVDTH